MRLLRFTRNDKRYKMVRLEKENILTLKVEDFASLIHNRDITLKSLRRKVSNLDLTNENLTKTLQKIVDAENRLNEPLTIGGKIKSLIFPFGFIINLLPNYNFFKKLRQELDEGYGKKATQYFRFSIVGGIIYLITLIYLLFFP